MLSGWSMVDQSVLPPPVRIAALESTLGAGQECSLILLGNPSGNRQSLGGEKSGFAGAEGDGSGIVDLSIAEVESAFGQQADVPLDIVLNEAVVYGANLVLSYDDEALSLLDVTWGPAADGMGHVANTEESGVIQVGVYTLGGPFTQDGTLLEMNFEVIGTLEDPAIVAFDSILLDEGTVPYSSDDGAVMDTVAPDVTIAPLNTSDTTPPLEGTVDDPNASVTVIVDSIQYSATNEGNGHWLLPDDTIDPPLARGYYTVGVTAVDLAGNPGSDTGTLYVAIPGDANCDGTVDDNDSAILASHWGQSGMAWGEGDFTGDGLVGPGDACILAANWGATPTPPTEEEASGTPVPSGPAVSIDVPFIGPVQAAVSRSFRKLIELPPERASSMGESAAVPEMSGNRLSEDLRAASRAREARAAHDVALAAECRREVGQASLQRRRLAWSFTLTDQQHGSQENTTRDEVDSAIDLLLLNRPE